MPGYATLRLAKITKDYEDEKAKFEQTITESLRIASLLHSWTPTGYCNYCSPIEKTRLLFYNFEVPYFDITLKPNFEFIKSCHILFDILCDDLNLDPEKFRVSYEESYIKYSDSYINIRIKTNGTCVAITKEVSFTDVVAYSC